MGKFLFLYFTCVFTCIAEGQLATTVADSIPKEQQARIEGLCYSAMLSPLVKETWPDLRSFNILNVKGDNVGTFSKTEAVVGPGPCTVTVEVRTRQRGSATLTLSFEAVAGGNYVLRPVYRGDSIHATIQNVDTGEMVARTWNLSKKTKPTVEPTSWFFAPQVPAHGLVCASFAFKMF
jgi:hypothetical protein